MHVRGGPTVIAVAFCLGLCAAIGEAEERTDAPLRAFVAKHCFDCHGAQDPEGGFSLAGLTLDLAEGGIAARWERVFDKVVRGEMPPADEPRPAAEETTAFTHSLRQRLHTASLARQQEQGRVAIRRLNRVEYENSLRDLLATPVRVRDLLPEDGVSAGFDTVSGALETSATHLVRYQQAADLALEAAAPTAPPKFLNETVTAAEWYERVHPNIRRFAGKSYRLEGETAILFHQDPPHADLDIFSREKPAAPGLYRLRLTVGARNTGGRPLPLRFIWQGMRADAKLGYLIDYRDVPPVERTTIELVIEVSAENAGRQNIGIQTITLPLIPRNEKEEPPPPDPATAPALLIHQYQIEGPLGGWPSPGYRRLFGDLPLMPRSVARALSEGKPAPTEDWTQRRPEQFAADPLVPYSERPAEDAERLIRDFLPRAFRRPMDGQLGEPLAEHYLRFVGARLDAGIEFREAMLSTYKAILCSPHFLLLLSQPGELDDHALAARLSYFLWSSLPDDELRAAADRGELRQPAALRAQVERMLAHEKSNQLVDHFTGQWLSLRQVLDMKPDEIYIEYDDPLGWSLAPESRRFFAEALARDLPVAEFVHSDWTYLNERLAKHYGVEGVHGYEMRRVALLPEHRRGGVLTHASVLKATANGTYTSPIKRGVWLLEQIAGTPPDPPPPDVEAIQPDIRGTVTLRDQIEKHRAIKACASCHAKIDPPGFALESYDVIGGHRTRYRVGSGAGPEAQLVELDHYPEKKKVYVAAPVDASATTADGQPFADLDGYKQILLRDPDQLARNLAQKLLVYGTGSGLQFADREVIEQIVDETREKNFGLRSIIHAVVQSRAFRHK